MRNISTKVRLGVAVTLIVVSSFFVASRREGNIPTVDSFEGVLMVGTCKVIDYSPIFRTPDGGRNPDEYSANLKGYAYPGQVLPEGMRAVTGREYAQRVTIIGNVQATLTTRRYIGGEFGYVPSFNINLGKDGCHPEGY